MQRGAFIVALIVLLMLTLPIAPSPISAAEPKAAPLIMAAGAPRFLGETATDDAFFAALEAANMTSFAPIFEYQEVPESKSLTREADFFPPCAPDEEPFRSMRAHGVKLVIPGNLFYASDLTLEQGDDDLRRTIECAGPGGIAGILSVDEPALGHPDLDTREIAVRTLYEHAKAIAPNVPVIMIHAPVVTEVLSAEGTWQPITAEDADRYLAAVARLSKWADVVGFDLYIIPSETAKISAPGHGIDIVDDTIAIPAYLDWLNTNAPDKQTMLVLQGFGYANVLGMNPGDPATRPPTRLDLARMACSAWRGSVSYLSWWGQSLLTESDTPLWNDITSVSAAISTEPASLCG